MSEIAAGLSQPWLTWLRDYDRAAKLFVEEEPVPVSSDEEREPVALKLALYARALTLFQGALLLIENDRQLDFRIHSRGVIEATMYLIALDRDPGFVAKMKDDDYKSRHSRASGHLNAADLSASPDMRRMLDEFVAQGAQGAKTINPGSLLAGTEFEPLYRTYRDISGDAAHVSVTSLSRHYVTRADSDTATLLLHPELDPVDMEVTVSDLGIALTIATLILMKVKKKTDLWDEFQQLVARYRTLTRPDRDNRRAATES